jgi:hypothetical protein
VAMYEHLASYHLALAGAFALTSMSPALFWTTMIVSFVTHGFLDRRWPVVRLLQLTGSEKFAETTWGVYATDQALHLSILLLCVGWAP